MSFRFYPDAEAELFEGIQYYEDVEPGFGQEFAVEVHSAVNRALAFPRAWIVHEREVRRALVQRFPYGVLYSCACSNHNLNRWVQKTKSAVDINYTIGYTFLSSMEVIKCRMSKQLYQLKNQFLKRWIFLQKI